MKLSELYCVGEALSHGYREIPSVKDEYSFLHMQTDTVQENWRVPQQNNCPLQ